ncbi:NAD(P)-binding domain-containing protein [Echinicola shivajiensis]|uniref:NAD(P)-binding domain-containing protein n=1 Tax=Echinicola shivajiensis TaxID=1035916 RepID=UPI001BFCBD23|nr:NAD(P)-binding domain-containing protein [Echinicola shivajiensis]
MRISIIGLGWLGKPLAMYLQAKGFDVMGSATSEEKCAKLQHDGLDCTLLKMVPHPEGKNFNKLFDTDVLIINIPPRRRIHPDTFHPEQIKYLKALIKQGNVKHVIYVSATSVYPDLNREVSEEEVLTRESTSNPALFYAEQILWQDKSYDLTVIRFGGLLGMDRVPGRYFSNKENVAGDPPVNYIHQTDAVRLIDFIIEKGMWNETYNGVSPLHPSKKAVYEKNFQDFRIAPPKSYKEGPSKSWKQVTSLKIQSRGFKFVYNNPLLFDYSPF